MKRDYIGPKPVYLVEQPHAVFTIGHGINNLRDFPMDEIEHRLTMNLIDEIAKGMKVVRYIESPVTGNIYDGINDYSPHDDPIGDVVYEAYLPQFNEMQKEINQWRRWYEELRDKHLAYEVYYRRGDKK